MTLLPVIDEYACSAHGDCVHEAPEAFALEDIAVVIGTAPDDRILAAARACPAGAISVFDESGRQVYP